MFSSVLAGPLGSVLAPFDSVAEEIAAAIQRKSFVRAMQLLRHNKEVFDVNTLLSSGQALLHETAAANALELMLELNMMGADVNILSLSGERPLHLAAREGHGAMVRLLLLLGADSSIPESQGQLAVELTDDSAIRSLLAGSGSTVQGGITELRVKMNQLGRRHEETNDPVDDAVDLQECVMKAARDTARSFRASSNEYSNMQMVLKCCGQSRPQLLTALRKKLQAEPSLASARASGLGQSIPDGFTPLHVAAAANNVEVLSLLLQSESAWSRDLQGRTPLHVAAAEGKEESCTLLRDAMLRERPGQDPIGPLAPVDLTGTTPLGWASFRADKRPATNIEKTLFSPGDRTVLPHTPRQLREGCSSARSRLRVSLQRSDLNEEGVKFGFAEANGWRPAMEDRTFVRCPLPKPLNRMSLFGVLDGHGGDFSASYLSDALPKCIYESLVSHFENDWTEKGLVDALTSAFAEAERNLREQPRMTVEIEGERRRIVPLIDKSGSTALVCCVTDKLIAVANVGDCRAVLAQRNKILSSFDALALSQDHKPILPLERKRIESAGAQIYPVNGDVFEVGAPGTDLKLRMSRSFGDFYLKQRPDISVEEQPIIAVPDVLIQKIDGRESFILLACDGVWDVLSNQDAVTFVSNCLIDQGLSAAESCDALLARCLELGSSDNVSAMVIIPSSFSSPQLLLPSTLDTPPPHLRSASSIGSVLRSSNEAESELIDQVAGFSLDDTVKKNLTLEFE